MSIIFVKFFFIKEIKEAEMMFKKMSKKEFKRIEKEWEKFENDFHGVI